MVQSEKVLFVNWCQEVPVSIRIGRLVTGTEHVVKLAKNRYRLYLKITHFPFCVSEPAYLVTRIRPERVPKNAVSTPSSTLKRI